MTESDDPLKQSYVNRRQKKPRRYTPKTNKLKAMFGKKMKR